MKSIRVQCKNLDTFYEVAKKHPLNSAYMLGNLYALKNTARVKDLRLIKQSIKTLQEKAPSSFSAEKLWDCMIEHRQKRTHLLTRGNQHSLQALRGAMLEDPFYFCHISDQKLIKLANTINCAPQVLIALIRKDCLANKEPDPFRHFDYTIFTQSGTHQNYRTINNFIKNCKTLPNSVLALCKECPNVANNVLKNISHTAHFFKISARIADYHPSLRLKIAKKWQHKCATYPVDDQQYPTILTLLTSLKRKYPEFKDVSLRQRPQRNYAPLANHVTSQKSIAHELHTFLNEHSAEITRNLMVGTMICYLQPQATPFVVGFGAVSLSGAFAKHYTRPQHAATAHVPQNRLAS